MDTPLNMADSKWGGKMGGGAASEPSSSPETKHAFEVDKK